VGVYNYPVNDEFTLRIGGGLLLQKYGGTPRNPNSINYGLRGLLGANYWFSEEWGARGDITGGLIPSPSGGGSTKDGNIGVEVGVVYRMGGAKDSDGDGVSDKNDKCPNTPTGVKVDESGCPIDTDKDGVPDHLDKCPNTPAGVRVDASGCPVDSDGDGVADYLDKCPNTPRGVKVDANGCPVDTDKDGVPDYLDKCPNTPAGVKVDSNGCPVDSDGDGVPDYLDKCPNTPRGTKVDANGCSIDADGDGVADADDKCPNTPRGVVVYKTGDRAGCPVDTDGDGVADYLDKCPNTPAGTKVDANGCAILFEAGKKSLTLTGVTFVTNSAELRPESMAGLDNVASSLVSNPDVKVAVEGYTDNVGKAAANIKLSAARAETVRQYIINKGVAADRITAKGFGPARPVASNKTEDGRSKNRRVELRKTN
jgi:OOP family OmpA-OmpF porin